MMKTRSEQYELAVKRAEKLDPETIVAICAAIAAGWKEDQICERFCVTRIAHRCVRYIYRHAPVV